MNAVQKLVEEKLEAAKAAGNTMEVVRWTNLLKEAGVLVESGLGIIDFMPFDGEERVRLTAKIRKGMKYAIVGGVKNAEGKLEFEVVAQSAKYRAANDRAESIAMEYGSPYAEVYAIEFKNELVAA
jgi:hypothetical protein